MNRCHPTPEFDCEGLDSLFVWVGAAKSFYVQYRLQDSDETRIIRGDNPGRVNLTIPCKVPLRLEYNGQGAVSIWQDP